MANLQVREVPTAVYGSLVEAARQEHRSLAQQTLITLKKGLGFSEDPRDRRKSVVRGLRERKVPDSDKLPAPVDLIREDRNR